MYIKIVAMQVGIELCSWNCARCMKRRNNDTRVVALPPVGLHAVGQCLNRHGDIQACIIVPRLSVIYAECHVTYTRAPPSSLYPTGFSFHRQTKMQSISSKAPTARAGLKALPARATRSAVVVRAQKQSEEPRSLKLNSTLAPRKSSH